MNILIERLDAGDLDAAKEILRLDLSFCEDDVNAFWEESRHESKRQASDKESNTCL